MGMPDERAWQGYSVAITHRLLGEEEFVTLDNASDITGAKARGVVTVNGCASAAPWSQAHVYRLAGDERRCASMLEASQLIRIPDHADRAHLLTVNLDSDRQHRVLPDAENSRRLPVDLGDLRVRVVGQIAC